MESKRNFFTGDEKLILKELVTKYRDIIENKKTDCVSTSQRKKAWIELANEFNAVAENTKRTSDQLKKCWDNMKTRRKKELSLEKKERMATGGGIYKPPPIKDDNIDVLDTVDIEMKDGIDSDTITLCKSGASTEYILKEDDILFQVVEDDLRKDVQSETADKIVHEHGSITPNVSIQERRSRYVSRGTAIERELEYRLRRNELLEKNERELHLLRIQEQQLKIKIAEEQLQQEQLKTLKLKNDLGM